MDLFKYTFIVSNDKISGSEQNMKIESTNLAISVLAKSIQCLDVNRQQMRIQ